MTPTALIFTALMLGLFVVTAGAWGAAYSLAIVLGRPALRRVAWACYAAHCAALIVIEIDTPLGGWWKLLIFASSVAYLAIPPITWRYLTRIHAIKEGRNDPQPARSGARIMAGMGRGA